MMETVGIEPIFILRCVVPEGVEPSRLKAPAFEASVAAVTPQDHCCQSRGDEVPTGAVTAQGDQVQIK